jgi:hypothetical protein
MFDVSNTNLLLTSNIEHRTSNWFQGAGRWKAGGKAAGCGAVDGLGISTPGCSGMLCKPPALVMAGTTAAAGGTPEQCDQFGPHGYGRQQV